MHLRVSRPRRAMLHRASHSDLARAAMPRQQERVGRSGNCSVHPLTNRMRCSRAFHSVGPSHHAPKTKPPAIVCHVPDDIKIAEKRIDVSFFWPGASLRSLSLLGRLVIVPRLALSARRAAGATAGAAATRGYLGRPLANLPCTGSHLFGLRRELQMCPQICSPWSLGSTPSKPTFIASVYLRALRAPRAWSRAGACAA